MKKDLDYYLSLEYPFVVEPIVAEEGGGYMVSYPDLPACISDGETVEEAIKMGEDAKISWIEASLAKDLDIPEPGSSSQYNGRITVRTPKSLHRKLVLDAKKEGVSLNQYMVYLLSRNREGKELAK